MSKKSTTKTEQNPAKKADFVFGKENYRLFIIGVLVIILGFILMSGTKDIMSFRKITLAPIVTIGGFVLIMIAILKKPKDKN